MWNLGGERVTAEGALPTHVVMKIAGGLWLFSSLLILIVELIVTPPVGSSRAGSVVVCGSSIAAGLLIWVFPWDRWSPSLSLWLVPLAFVTIGLNLRLGNGNGFIYAITFLIVFVWLGLAHPRGPSLWFAPLLAVGYLAPLIGMATRQAELGMASAFYVVPSCVLVGEA